MIAPIPPGAVSSFGSVPGGGSERERLGEAAQQFEAILVRQMLAAARSTDFGGDELFGQSDETFTEMRDAEFARLASQSGAIGLAAQIEARLARHLETKG